MNNKQNQYYIFIQKNLKFQDQDKIGDVYTIII